MYILFQINSTKCSFVSRVPIFFLKSTLWVFFFFFFRVSERLQEAAEVRDDVVGVVAVDEALPAVVYEPAEDAGAAFLIAPVVLLPTPEIHGRFTEDTRFFRSLSHARKRTW